MIDLGTLGGESSQGTAISNSGQVVGYSNSTVGGPQHAFLFSPDTKPMMIDLQALLGVTGVTASSALAVNRYGQVVGYANLSAGGSYAFLYTADKGMVDLNTLLPPGSGWILQGAYGINDTGQITGFGTVNGVQHAFVLSRMARKLE